MKALANAGAFLSTDTNCNWLALLSTSPATGRHVSASKAADGRVVELFEGAPGLVERAHSNAVVRTLYKKRVAVCEIASLNQPGELSTIFASSLQSIWA